MLPATESTALLRKYGIPMAKTAIAHDEEGAVKAAHDIGYPVAIKVDSPDIIHKTERGVVAHGIKSEAELREAFRRVMKSAGSARVSGIIVQEHCHGTEIIIGGKYDAQFGETVLFGVGGIFVEIFKDVSLRVTPFSANEALEMIKEVKGYPILAGARGQQGVDIGAIADAIMRVQKLMENEPVAELDLNPVFATKGGVKAVDARIIMR
jgi:acyl-CoA synthetase (NDP forming)